MRNLIIIAASLLTLTAAEAQNAAPPDWWPREVPWVDVTTEFEAWRACVAAKADRFSKGPDEANLIVQAALIACKEERSRVVQQFDKKDPKGAPPPTVLSSGTGLPPILTHEAFVSDLEARVIQREALLRVIESRAAK